VIRIASRANPMALYQADLVKTKIESTFPLIPVELHRIKTRADMIRRISPHPFAPENPWLQEVEDSLRAGEVDLIACGGQELSTQIPSELAIGAVLFWEDERDCFVSEGHLKISQLPLGARVGVNSWRRQMQVLRWNPDLVVEIIFGSVEARLKKMHAGEVDGILLSYAGVKRLGLTGEHAEVLPSRKFYPAPGQGSVVVERRAEDPDLDEIVRALDDPVSRARLGFERSFVSRLGAGYDFPCGIWTLVKDKRIEAGGIVLDFEKSQWAEAEIEGCLEDAVTLGQTLAENVLTRGGAGILEKIKNREA